MKIIHKIFRASACICLVVTHVFGQSIPTTTVNNTLFYNQNATYQTSGKIVSPSSPSYPTAVVGTSQVDFIAEKDIDLKPGFSAQDLTGNGQFHAIIAQSVFDVVFIEPNSSYPQVPRYEKLEIGLKLPANIEQLVDDYFANNSTGINPYDYNQINIEATFTKGSLSRKMYGFYYKEYQRNANDINWDPIVSDYRWRIRFAPDEIGAWNCSITVNFSPSLSLPSLTESSTPFNCITNPDPEEKGYVQPYSIRNLRFSDGSCFFPIGRDQVMHTYLAWANHPYFNRDQLVSDYITYEGEISLLADKGANYFRMIMQPSGYDLQWNKLGDYDDKQYSAWEMDRLMDLLYEKNIYIQLSMFDYGEFSANNGGTFYGWDYPFNDPYPTHPGLDTHSPYGDIPGITGPRDVFASGSPADSYIKRKIRYILSRWGYNTHIAAYEIMNEIDNACEYFDVPQDESTRHRPYVTDAAVRSDVYHWQTSVVAPFIKSTDEDKHLLTTSYAAGPFSGDNTFDDSNFDITQIHSYHPSPDINFATHNTGETDRSNAVKQKVNDYLKPTLFGEMGWGCNSLLNPCDNEWLYNCSDERFHDDLWATAFIGGYGAGLNWWGMANSSLSDNFFGLRNFLSGVDMSEMSFPEYKHQSIDHLDCINYDNCEGKIEYYAMKGGPAIDRAIGWAHNINCNFENLFDWQSLPSCIARPWGNSYDANGFEEGIVLTDMFHSTDFWGEDYKIHWYDPDSGNYLYTTFATTGAHFTSLSTLKIPCPGLGFNTPDLAFKVELVDESSWRKFNQENPGTIDGESRKAICRVFPNPTTNSFIISYPGELTNPNVELINVMGHSVYKKQFDKLQKEEIDISNLSPGVYYVRISNREGINETHKVIKQ
jgi:hypothetical protein